MTTLTERVQDMHRRIKWFVDSRPYLPQPAEEICPTCGEALIVLRQPSNVRGCANCQDMYYLKTERKIAFMQIGE